MLLLCCCMKGVLANPIGLSQALKIAAAYMEEMPTLDNLAPIRRGSVRGSADTLAPYYVFNRGDNAGFVIVSGDDCLPEVIGYADSGDFVEEQMPPALLDMLEGYTELVAQAQAAGAPARTPRKAVAGRVNIDPIVKAHWHQSSPYNDLAPFITNTTNRAATGCTCTAAVMVLHHFRRDLPGELLASTPTYGYGDAPVTVSYPKGTPILWDLMQNNYSGNIPEEMRNAVAVLNAAFGAGIWQTYGSSTSGQISNIVDGYNQYFNLSSTCQYKGGTSQSSWENMVYNNLSNGQPIVYAGVHPTNGGHAIILDGYNASNGLFHFNFGWGGQGDGYYTLDDETGVNGFAGQQGMVYNIAPKQPKVSAKLYVDAKAYKRVESTIRVVASNHGTLDYSGFNLYWGTTNRVPTSSTKVSETNTSLQLATGESGEFVVPFKPTTASTYYVFLTDKNCNVLDKIEIDVQTVSPALSLQSFDITASAATESYNEEEYRLLYNDKLEAVALISNAPDATPLQTNIRLELMKYNEESNALELEKNLTISAQDFLPGEVTEVRKEIDDLVVGERYALCIRSLLRNVENDEALCANGVDTLVRFKVCSPTLDTLSVEGTAMTLVGEWDALRFRELSVNEAVASYDLTRVAGVSGQPVAANPNALFYVSEPVGGYNTVCEGICDELRLQPGADFVPSSSFVAQRAMFTPQWTIDEEWQPFALPFTAVKPQGYICRQVVNISTSAITEVKVVDTLYAHAPYMVMACENRPFVGEEVVISATPVKPDTEVPQFEAVVSAMVADDSTLVYNYIPEDKTQYFVRADKGTPVEPFTAVFRINAKRIRSYTSSNLNGAYQGLAEVIAEANHAYGLLHPQIETEWNELLLDSIAKAYDVYGTMQWKATEVQAYTERLQSLVEVYRLKLAVVDSPICYNALLVNPSFELGTKEGWTMEGSAKPIRSTSLSTLGVGSVGDYLLYDATEVGPVGISQTVSDLPVGYYRLTAMAGVGKEDAVALFAGDSICILNPHPWGQYYLEEYAIDSVWVETGELTLGISGGDSWYKVDEFKLYHLGDENSQADTDIDALESVAPSWDIRYGIYDLFGRRVADRKDMQDGVMYIVNGRKIVYRME